MREDLDEERTENFDVRKYVVIAKRRLLYFFVPLFVGWAIVWGASWVLPSVYRSGTLILVEQPSVPSQFVVPNIAGNLQDRLQTMTEQILSRTRLLHIIETLDLYAKKRQHMATDEVVEQMRKDIEIELVRSPGRDAVTSFNVFYSASDPVLAQRVTNELTNLFINENLEARQEQSESTTKFLERQLEDARVSLAEQEAKVRRYKDQHLGELPGQLQSNLQVLAGLQSQLQSESDALNRAKQQNVYLQSLLAQYRSVQNSIKAGADVPVGLPALEQELDRLRAQLADLTSHYTDRYPDVRKVKEQIARAEQLKLKIESDLKGRAAAAPTDAMDNGASSSADVHDTTPTLELKSQLKVNVLEIQNRERSIQVLQARIVDYQGRLNQEPMREQELTEITRGYDQSKANYDSLLAKRNSSELATNLEMEQKSEHFRILDPPSLPQKPFSPNRLKLCGIGLGVGLLLGAIGVAGSEVLDDGIYTDEELKKLLPTAILSDIPEISTVREQRNLQRKQRLQWLAAGVLSILMIAGSTISVFRG